MSKEDIQKRVYNIKQQLDALLSDVMSLPDELKYDENGMLKNLEQPRPEPKFNVGDRVTVDGDPYYIDNEYYGVEYPSAGTIVGFESDEDGDYYRINLDYVNSRPWLCFYPEYVFPPAPEPQRVELLAACEAFVNMFPSLDEIKAAIEEAQKQEKVGE